MVLSNSNESFWEQKDAIRDKLKADIAISDKTNSIHSDDFALAHIKMIEYYKKSIMVRQNNPEGNNEQKIEDIKNAIIREINIVCKYKGFNKNIKLVLNRYIDEYLKQ